MILVQITKENSAYLADALLLDTSKEAQDAVENHSMMLSAKELFPVLETMKQIRQYGDSTDKNYGYRDEGSMFNSGNTAMYINGVWASKLIDEKNRCLLCTVSGKEWQHDRQFFRMSGIYCRQYRESRDNGCQC